MEDEFRNIEESVDTERRFIVDEGKNEIVLNSVVELKNAIGDEFLLVRKRDGCVE